jgi:hypothetical protein
MVDTTTGPQRLNVKQRLAMIAGVAIVSSFSVGMLLAGLESLSRLLQS